MYDSRGLSLDDTTYSSKNFAGNKIFGYKVGSGTNDSVLGFAPYYTSYNSISNYQFENFLNSDTTVDGFKYYKNFDYKNILKDTIEYDLTVNPDFVTSGNRIYIDNVKQQTLSLQRGNVYRLLMNDSSFGSKGYTKGYHPVLLSTTQDGTHNSGTVYNTGVKYYLNNSEVTEAVFKSAQFNTSTSRYIEIEPTSSTPDTLYYYCHVHAGMGGKVLMLNNPYTTVDEKTETNYYNEWRAVDKKSKQKLIQEFETDEYSDKNNFKLDVIISDMAADTTGSKSLDSIRTNQLCADVIGFSKETLKPRGVLISKLFMGEDFIEVKNLAKSLFRNVNFFKPESSRNESKETYLHCKILNSL